MKGQIYKILKIDQNNKFLIECLKKGNINLLATNMVNVLETVTSKMHEEIKRYRKGNVRK